MVEFKNREHKKAFERINKFLRDLFGEAGATASDDRPHWMVNFGSSLVHVSVAEWRDKMNIVQITSYVAQGTEITPSCMRYLLEESCTMVHGAFSIDSDGDITFSHSVIAETCEKNDLKLIIMAVGNTADCYDDTIVERWGGKRHAD